ALALSMLLLFDSSAGIAGASILSSGILVLLIAIAHSLLCASRISQGIPGNSDPPQSLYENDSAQPGEIEEQNQRFRPEIQREFPEIQREFSFPALPAGEKEFQREFRREWMETPRMHRTLSAESGLLQGKKPWNVVSREMRNAMARRAKDSTLV
ncbi:TM221 protein, partial [Grantiella picta]|nr:TM221 protein [Grantiella picta]